MPVVHSMTVCTSSDTTVHNIGHVDTVHNICHVDTVHNIGHVDTVLNICHVGNLGVYRQ